MYVIFPVDELLRIYENSASSLTFVERTRETRGVGGAEGGDSRRVPPTLYQIRFVEIEKTSTSKDHKQVRKKKSSRPRYNLKKKVEEEKEVEKEKIREEKKEKEESMQNQRNVIGEEIGISGVASASATVIATSSITATTTTTTATATATAAATATATTTNNPLKDLIQPGLNEPLKQHNSNALKLVQTISEFAQELGTVMEGHSANVRRLVDGFRGRTGESRIESGGSMRRIWENLLRQVEADATAHLDLAAVLQQQFSRPTIEVCFHRKLQSRKVFSHREAYEQVMNKTEEKLQRARADYKRAYSALLGYEGGGGGGGGPGEQEQLKRAYLEAHNAYVLQLRATNAITERYQQHCLPRLLGEIAEVYEELCVLACKCIAGISEAAGERAGEQAKRYHNLAKEAQTVSPFNDLQVLAKNLTSNNSGSGSRKMMTRRLFMAPQPLEQQILPERMNQVPILRDELVSTGGGSSNLPSLEELKRDHETLSQEIGRLQDSLDALLRMQRKSAESNLFTKVAELQEDISMKRFDLGVAHLHLAAVQAQKELFGGAEANQPDGPAAAAAAASRKMSNGSTTASPKHKWLKAFKSLKSSSPSTPATTEKKSFESTGGHSWSEYTYKKITPCDTCEQVLRGHSRQGFRCSNCKANAHADCMNLAKPCPQVTAVPRKTGGLPLLRRQKTQQPVVDEQPLPEHNVDAIYQVLKQAGEIRGNSTNSPPTPPTTEHPSSGVAPSSGRTSSHRPCSSSTSGRRGSGGSTSGTRPFGQPLILMSPEVSSSLANHPVLRRNRSVNKKMR